MKNRTQRGDPDTTAVHSAVNIYRSTLDQMLLGLFPAVLVWTIFFVAGRIHERGVVLFCLGITLVKMAYALATFLDHLRGKMNSSIVIRREGFMMAFDMLMVLPFFYFFKLP